MLILIIDLILLLRYSWIEWLFANDITALRLRISHPSDRGEEAWFYAWWIPNVSLGN